MGVDGLPVCHRYRTSRQHPAAPLRGTFKAHKSRNFAALTKAEEFGQLLARVYAYDGSPITRSALQLIAYTFTRTGELRAAEWTEIDFATATWRIPAEKMKMREEHVVPLSTQAARVLSELRMLTGHSRWVFPNAKDKTPKGSDQNGPKQVNSLVLTASGCLMVELRPWSNASHKGVRISVKSGTNGPVCRSQVLRS